MEQDENKTSDMPREGVAAAEQKETPAVEPPVEQIAPEPASPEERPPSAPLPEDLPPAPRRTGEDLPPAPRPSALVAPPAGQARETSPVAPAAPPNKSAIADTARQDEHAEQTPTEPPSGIIEQKIKIEPASPEERPPSAPLPKDLPPAPRSSALVAPPAGQARETSPVAPAAPPNKSAIADTAGQDEHAEQTPTEPPSGIIEQKIKIEPASPEERPPSAPLPEDLPPAPRPSAKTETAPREQARPDISPSSRLDTRCPSKVVEKIIYRAPANLIQNLLIKARAKIQERRRKKLDKIMALFSSASLGTSGTKGITNKDVQKLLRTTKRTATRYFDRLEREGKITQVGKTGRGVLYVKSR